jgi:protein-S-isoprenylcysteine O-methyltransferase Ste14
LNHYITYGIWLCWLIFFAYWWLSSLQTKSTAQTEPALQRFVFYWLPLIVAGGLLGPGYWYGHSWLRENFVPHSNMVGITGLALCILGLTLSIWARVILGKNWSLSVEVKQGHELVTQGPYRVIRHPIYTALILMFSGNALVVGDYRAILAVVIVTASFWYKLRKEEKWMLQNFGDAYRQYMLNTKALIPGVL